MKKYLCLLLSVLLLFTGCGLFEIDDHSPFKNGSNNKSNNSSDQTASEQYDLTLFDNSKVGDVIVFGSYEQDNDFSNGKEPIEWIVLNKTADEILVISKYILDYRPPSFPDVYTPRPYDKNFEHIIPFPEISYSDEELTAIVENEWTISVNNELFTKKYRTFVLSHSEVVGYLPPEIRGAEFTEYAKSKDGVGYEDKLNPKWYTSSTVYDDFDSIICIDSHGEFCVDFKDSVFGMGMRPSIKIKASPTTENITQSPIYCAGDSFTFGNYNQDNNTANGDEPIEWIVLDSNGDSLLMISKHVIDFQPYNSVSDTITWKKSKLRSWLNRNFFRTAFTENEQKKILPTTTTHQLTPYEIETTEDKVFLLDSSQFKTYILNPAISLYTSATPYAQSLGAVNYHSGINSTDPDYCAYWLRCGTHGRSSACFRASIDEIYSENVARYCGVRPIITVKIS